MIAAARLSLSNRFKARRRRPSSPNTFCRKSAARFAEQQADSAPFAERQRSGFDFENVRDKETDQNVKTRWQQVFSITTAPTLF
jgi:hypothetical protein